MSAGTPHERLILVFLGRVSGGIYSNTRTVTWCTHTHTHTHTHQHTHTCTHTHTDTHTHTHTHTHTQTQATGMICQITMIPY